ncbi:MAG: alanine racemase [Pseudomonadota bacterium]
MDLTGLSTPTLILDKPKMVRNIERMASRIDALGGTLRPHVKTHKSIEVWKEVRRHGPVKGMTVSTLKEAHYFFEHGETDIFYAVSLAPNKFLEATNLIKAGCDLKVTLDNVAAAKMLSEFAEENDVVFKVIIELDVDGHRSGIDPKSDLLIGVARHLTKNCELAGVMTHAGESYGCRTRSELKAAAQNERDATVHAAKRLRDAGFACKTVSIGSTPTICTVNDLTGITEVRPGVYTFFDLVMQGVGVCKTEDIAISVLATVIGHQKERNWVITDAGWMAMSRDRGTSNQDIDYGYGQVCDTDGSPISDLHVLQANQEHGVIASMSGAEPPWDRLPVGAMVRVLPNHACATATQYDGYQVLEDDKVVGEWGRIAGW